MQMAVNIAIAQQSTVRFALTDMVGDGVFLFGGFFGCIRVIMLMQKMIMNGMTNLKFTTKILVGSKYVLGCWLYLFVLVVYS